MEQAINSLENLFKIAIERNNLELFQELLKLLGDIYYDFGNFDKAV